MPSVYERFGIRFLYPEGWDVSDELDEQTLQTVSVQSPSGAFWSVSVDSSQRAANEMLRETLHSMQDEYEDVEVSSIVSEIEGQPASGFEMNFFCLDFQVTAQALAWRSGPRSILVLSQAESREFERLRQVFQAISVSLLRKTDVRSPEPTAADSPARGGRILPHRGSE